MASTSFQVAGLASGFDWKGFLDQIMEVERAPAARLAAERAANTQKAGLLETLGSRLTSLQDAAAALRNPGVFGRRMATSTTAGSTWRAAASPDTPLGTYRVTVRQLAAPAMIRGGTGLAAPLGTGPDAADALTLATLPIRQQITAGTFSINGQRVTISLADSLQDVFDAIGRATDGDVEARYDPVSDRVTLTRASGPLMLGAANDTSNFLAALGLGNTGTSTAASNGALGALKPNAPLRDANLRDAIGADEEGRGAFTINGVSIAYDVNADSLHAVLARINDSGAGVSARYDAVAGRVELANRVTGDLGTSVQDTAGGLLAALGLTGMEGFARGRDAEFTINDGPVLRSASNTFGPGSHGIAGLEITADREETQTITVAADTAAMRAPIETFLARFNEVQQFIESSTQITSDGKGKVTAAPLAGNREVQEWGRTLRALAFNVVGGLDGPVTRLDDFGIDFKRGTSELQIADGGKLARLLEESGGAVANFFGGAAGGFSARLEGFIAGVTAQGKDQRQRLNVANEGIADQIAAIERRIAQQRELMEAAFLQMERAQSTIRQQQSAIDGMFASLGAKK